MEELQNNTHAPAAVNPYTRWFFGIWLLALLFSAGIRSTSVQQTIHQPTLLKERSPSISLTQIKLY